MAVESSTAMQRASFHIRELDCAQEVLLLRQELERQPGIGELEFDVINSRMFVAYDAQRTSPQAIVDRLDAMGMHARPWQEVQPQQQGDSQTFWQRHGRLMLACCAAAALLAGLISHAWLGGGLAAALGYPTTAAALAVPLVSRALYSLSIACSYWFVLPKAWIALRRARADMNLLMCVAVGGAIVLGEWLEAATVSFLFLMALLLEHWSMDRARRAIAALMDLSPMTARCRDATTAQLRELPVEQVSVGTRVVVRPGEKIPLDGHVLEGASTVDQAPITGESRPVSKQPGARVFAGTINGEGVLEVEVTRPAGDTTLARIIQMVQQAHARRAPSEQWVEKFARLYTPSVMALAIAVALVPPLVFAAAWSAWAYNALVLLVIACPCALVISTPVSIVSALTSAARRGVLIKGGRYLEACTDLKAVAIDKTGTLTYGQPVVHRIVPTDGQDQAILLKWAATMEAHSSHPVARAILHRAQEEGLAIEQVDNYRVLSGRGAEADIGGKSYWIGSRRLLRERMPEEPHIAEMAAELEDAGHSVIAVGDAERVFGLISVADRIREGAHTMIQALRQLGVRHICMLTGDHEKTAREVAQLTGVDQYLADALPEDKVREVEALRRRFSSVAMIGDGVNDSPAMATSTLGIAMGAIGTDTAIETADIALMSDDLSKLPWLVAHARRAVAIVQQNITLALAIKLLFVALATLGAASLWMAIAADMGASLLVIFNGLRLLR